MNLLGQGCGIWIGFHLNVEVDGNYVFKYESKNVVPTDGAKLMKCEFVSRNRQMDPTFSLRECILKNGHQCGACHNVSDAKIRIGKHFVKGNRLAR